MPQPYSFLPDKHYARELRRPWKLLSFAIAMSWLLYGALFYGIGDWDVGVTLIMGSLTYLLAPWSIYVIAGAGRYRPRGWYLQILAALIAWLLVVDWVYLLYHHWAGNPVYRWDNFKASTPLYFMAGLVWLYRGSLRQLVSNLGSLR